MIRKGRRMTEKPVSSFEAPVINSAFEAVLNSDHVSQRTRDIMFRRAQPDDPAYAPVHMSRDALTLLRALLERVLPQAPILDASRIDIAARIDQRLGQPGDGWRFAALPPDPEAYRHALETLDNAAFKRFRKSFVGLTDMEQDDLIEAMALKTLIADGMTAEQMALWFSDLRADAVQLFISHPAVQGALGIDAVANGGDRIFQGFSAIGEGAHEDWEPAGPRALA